MLVPCADFVEALVVERDNPVALPAALKPKAKEVGLKRGLSPYMLEKNSWLQAAKRAKGGTLTEEEHLQARAEFKEHWNRIGNTEPFADAYQVWRQRHLVQQAPAIEPYRLMWGGGCRASPVAKEELHDEVQRHGWPTYAEVVDPGGAQFKILAETGVDFEASATFNLWGLGRAARNVRTTPEERSKFEMIEKGIFSWLEHLGREVADRGDLMIMVVGDHIGRVGQIFRMAAIVSGVTYNPKIFEVTWLAFEEEGLSSAIQLTFPFKVYVADRPCKISPHFQTIEAATSDEFIAKLFDKMANIRLYRLVYDAIIEHGSNKWSSVKSAESLGQLWEPGQRQHLRFESAGGAPRSGLATAERIFEGLFEGDPFSSGGGDVGQRGGRGVGGRGRGRHRGLPFVLPWGRRFPANTWPAAHKLRTIRAGDALGIMSEQPRRVRGRVRMLPCALQTAPYKSGRNASLRYQSSGCLP